jgi:hypothetical protein
MTPEYGNLSEEHLAEVQRFADATDGFGNAPRLREYWFERQPRNKFGEQPEGSIPVDQGQGLKSSNHLAHRKSIH